MNKAFRTVRITSSAIKREIRAGRLFSILKFVDDGVDSVDGKIFQNFYESKKPLFLNL